MIVYDIEIVNPPKTSKTAKIDGIEKYAEGWEDYLGMGISVIGTYNYINGAFNRWFGDDQEHMLEVYNIMDNADLIIGFNNLKFDNPLLQAHGVPMGDSKSYDILRQIWFAAGLTEIFNPMTHGGYNLDAVAMANLGTGKTGKGEFAPWLWAKGKRDEVAEYCINDVVLTKRLMDKIFEQGGLIDPKTKQFLKIALPKI